MSSEMERSMAGREFRKCFGLAIPSWLEEVLLKDQLLSLWVFPCVLFVVFPLLLLIFVLCVDLC